MTTPAEDAEILAKIRAHIERRPVSTDGAGRLELNDEFLLRLLDAERAKITGYQRECAEVEQVLGKALGYPWYKDDPKNFPNAAEESGVCVGEHTPASVAAEASERITAERANSEGLRTAGQALFDACERASIKNGSWIFPREMFDWKAALSASPSPTLPNTRMGEDAVREVGKCVNRDDPADPGHCIRCGIECAKKNMSGVLGEVTSLRARMQKFADLIAESDPLAFDDLAVRGAWQDKAHALWKEYEAALSQALTADKEGE